MGYRVAGGCRGIGWWSYIGIEEGVWSDEMEKKGNRLSDVL